MVAKASFQSLEGNRASGEESNHHLVEGLGWLVLQETTSIITEQSPQATDWPADLSSEEVQAAWQKRLEHNLVEFRKNIGNLGIACRETHSAEMVDTLAYWGVTDKTQPEPLLADALVRSEDRPILADVINQLIDETVEQELADATGVKVCQLSLNPVEPMTYYSGPKPEDLRQAVKDAVIDRICKPIWRSPHLNRGWPTVRRSSALHEVNTYLDRDRQIQMDTAVEKQLLGALEFLKNQTNHQAPADSISC